MKRLAACLIILLLLGCAEDNPFRADTQVQSGGGTDRPHIDAAGTESGGAGSSQLSDMDPETPGIQDAVIIQFDKEMDPASITASSFQMERTDPGQGTVSFNSVDYYPEIRTAVLTGTFTDDTAYLLTVTAGSVTDIAGMELDPNRNAAYDGSPWDDRLLAFATGAAGLPDVTSPRIDLNAPYGGGVTNLRPNVRVFFQDGPMDESQLTLSRLTLVRTSDSSAVELELLQVSGDGIITNPADSLSSGTRYTARLSAGLADSSGNILDTNGDGLVWPDEPDLVWDFQTADDSTTHSAPPTLAEAVLMPGLLQVNMEFEESLTGALAEMDPATFTASTVQAMDSEGSIPLSFYAGADPASMYALLQRTPQGPVTLHISCSVADVHGNLFDGNNDGLGGTPEEDDWWGVL